MLPTSFINREIDRFVKPKLANMGVLGDALFYDWQKTVAAQKNKTVHDANQRLRQMKQRLKWGGYNLANMDNESVCDYCETRAKNSLKFLPKFPESLPVAEIQYHIESVGRFDEHSLVLDLPDNDEDKLSILRGFYARICDPIWWRRKLKRAQKQAVEGVARDIGLVQKNKGGYCSNISLFNQRKQTQRNAKLLDSMVAENQFEQSFYLSELQDKSISNPEVRRAELMTRIRGFEILAEKQNYVAAFWTITCPSKFHAFYSSGGLNEKYQGSSVLDAQKYLVHLWAGFRAWLGRNGIDGFGFRVSEPHHDGCPHWHILYFGNKAELERATQELEERCLRVDGEESGAQKNRFKVEWIKQGEDERGRKLSAAAYIAKYIAKSIDGYQVGKDKETDQDTKQSSERVVAWSRVWGIRQFQQIGGAPVGLWRELRRLDGVERSDTQNEYIKEAESEVFGLHETLEEFEDQAEAWAVFNMMVGSGRDTLFKLWKSDEPETIRISQFIDTTTGEVMTSNQINGVAKRNQYGEPVKVIKGLLVDIFGHVEHVKTRFFEWALKRVNEARQREKSLEGVQPLLL